MRGRWPCRLPAAAMRRPIPGRQRPCRAAVAPVPGAAGAAVPGSAGGAGCRREPLRWRARASRAFAWDRWTELPHRPWGTVKEFPTAAGSPRTATGQAMSGWWVRARPARSSERVTGRAGSGIRAASACRCRVRASRKAQASAPGPRTPRRPAREHPPPRSVVAAAPSVVVSGAGTRDTALDAGTPAERTSTAPSAAAAVPRRRPPWKPVSVRVSSDF